jgi:ribosomal protein S18 acetylase RimI-like enzyme
MAVAAKVSPVMEVIEITTTDDLETLVSQINQATWDEANDVSEYEADALLVYLKRQDTIFVVCRDNSADNSIFMGMASCRIEYKPYDNERWLYVDEVDVCADQRQKGAGKLIMQKLIEIAEKSGCDELWLATEKDNFPANALYRSLDPDDISDVVGYTYETDD